MVQTPFAKFEAELRLAGISLNVTEIVEYNDQVYGLNLKNLSAEEFTQFPLHSPYLAGLQRLILPSLKVGAVPDLSHFRMLTHLSLPYWDISTIPTSFFQFSEMRVLDLSGNLLQDLPAAITNLQQLQVINLGGNRLSSLPDQFWDMGSIRCLALGSNHLTEIPDDIAKMTELRQLYLYNNQLTDLPEAIGQLSNLELLSIDKNPLQQLPYGVMELTNLKDFRYPVNISLTPANYFWLNMLKNDGTRINTSKASEVCYDFGISQ